MGIITSQDLAQGAYAVEVDLDPTVSPPDVPVGSLIFYAGIWYRKVTGGVISELGPHAAAHLLGAVDPIATLPTSDQKSAMDAASPVPGATNPFITQNNPNVKPFGRRYKYAESLPISITTSENWTTKLSLVTEELEMGTYRFCWACLTQRMDNKQGDIRVYNETDDEVLGEAEIANYEWSHAGAFCAKICSGVKTVKMQWSTRQVAKAIGIQAARMDYWRVL